MRADNLLALKDGKPAGSASLVNLDLSSRQELSPWLATVYVSPNTAPRASGLLWSMRRRRGARAEYCHALLIHAGQDALLCATWLDGTETIEYRGLVMTVARSTCAATTAVSQASRRNITPRPSDRACSSSAPCLWPVRLAPCQCWRAPLSPACPHLVASYRRLQPMARLVISSSP